MMPANENLQALGEVRCYCDLHRSCSSLKAMKGPDKGRVVGKPKTVVLRSVRFEINQAGLARCRREGVRNVHAYARGEVVGTDIASVINHPEVVRITYNPHLYDHFVRVEDKRPIAGAQFMAIDGKTAYAVGVVDFANDHDLFAATAA